MAKIQEGEPLRLGPFCLDPARRDLSHEGQVTHLSWSVFAIALRLIERPERPVTFDRLISAIWGGGDMPDGWHNVLHVQVYQLRKRMRAIGLDPYMVMTVRDVGYMLTLTPPRYIAVPWS